jgi:hypothetical protein
VGPSKGGIYWTNEYFYGYAYVDQSGTQRDYKFGYAMSSTDIGISTVAISIGTWDTLYTTTENNNIYTHDAVYAFFTASVTAETYT